MRLLTILVLTALAFVASAASCSGDPTIVQTSGGCVQGFTDGAVRTWKGLPYAEPPVGPLRWAAPVPAQPWSGTLVADQSQQGCPQDCFLPAGLCPNVTSEDCLYIDIVVPASALPTSQLPVMVFFAGGAFYQGTGFSALYNGSVLATEGNIVIVTCNYRLGALGFFASTSMNLPGNQGLADQRLVLQWVRDNIAGFGGNPNHVVIQGESAGAESIQMHLISPASAGLFHAAVTESLPALPLKTMTEASSYADKLAKAVGCAAGDLTCLLAVPAANISMASGNIFVFPDPFAAGLLEIFYAFAPVVDGVIIPEQPMDAIRDHKFNASVPLLIGCNANEGVMFVYGALAPVIGSGSMSDIEYAAAVTAVYDIHAPAILERYACPFGTDCRVQFSEILTDYIFACPARYILDTYAALNTNTNTYMYVFDHVMADTSIWGPQWSFCYNASCHGAELAFVWNSVNYTSYTLTHEENVLAAQMGAYWTSFITTLGGTTGANSPAVSWPNYVASGARSIARMMTPSVLIQSDLPTQNCDFWDSIFYDF